MIQNTIARWHRLLEGDPGVTLDALLADDCVFYSPIVFTPQRGKAKAAAYLRAALSVFGAGGPAETRPFRYVKETFAPQDAVLEFETEIDGKYVNGVDIISCDERGEIEAFKVMVRPLQAIELIHRRMAEMLAAAGA